MAGTIITDRIESDASYASSITVASPMVVANTITMGSAAAISGNVNFDSGTLFVDAVNNRVGVGNSVTNPNYSLHVKAPSGEYRTALFETENLNGPSVQIKGSKTYELRSTNSGAGEGAGLFFIYDKDNELVRLQIDASGRVTMPSQPSFLAGSNSGDTTFASSAIIAFDSIGTSGFNVGSNYNTSTYRFTAPVAGKYFFSCIAYYTESGGNTQSMQLAPILNGSQIVVGGDAILFSSMKPSDCGGIGAIGGSVVLNLAANDYVSVYARGTAARLYMGHTKFSGYLLG